MSTSSFRKCTTRRYEHWAPNLVDAFFTCSSFRAADEPTPAFSAGESAIHDSTHLAGCFRYFFVTFSSSFRCTPLGVTLPPYFLEAFCSPRPYIGAARGSEETRKKNFFHGRSIPSNSCKVEFRSTSRWSPWRARARRATKIFASPVFKIFHRV